MSSSTAMELRNRQRRRTLLGGKIIFLGGFSVTDCVVRNISDTGACLELPSIVGIPNTFELTIPMSGLRAKCRVAWRRGQRIGVAFEETHKL